MVNSTETCQKKTFALWPWSQPGRREQIGIKRQGVPHPGGCCRKGPVLHCFPMNFMERMKWMPKSCSDDEQRKQADSTGRCGFKLTGHSQYLELVLQQPHPYPTPVPPQSSPAQPYFPVDNGSCWWLISIALLALHCFPVDAPAAALHRLAERLGHWQAMQYICRPHDMLAYREDWAVSVITKTALRIFSFLRRAANNHSDSRNCPNPVCVDPIASFIFFPLN